MSWQRWQWYQWYHEKDCEWYQWYHEENAWLQRKNSKLEEVNSGLCHEKDQLEKDKREVSHKLEEAKKQIEWLQVKNCELEEALAKEKNSGLWQRLSSPQKPSLVVYCKAGLKVRLMMGRQLFVALDVTDAVDCGWGGDWPRDRDLHITVLYDHHGYGVDDLKEAVVVLSEYLTGVEFSFQLQSEGAWTSSRRAIVCKGDYLLSTLSYVQRRYYPCYYPYPGWQPHVSLGAGRCSPGPVKV